MMGLPVAGDCTAIPASAAVNENGLGGVGEDVDDGDADGGASCVAGAAQCHSSGVASSSFQRLHSRRE